MSAQQPSQDELEKLKKQVDAQRELIEAQTKLIEAQRAQQQAAELADAKSAKTVADAQKAAADARKADADAQAAAFKAMIGEVPSSGIQGNVETKDKAGVTEAALLAGRATRLAAQTIADELPPGEPPAQQAAQPGQPLQPALAPAKQVLLLYTSSDVPNFNALLTFRAQTTLIREALEEAERVSIGAMQKAPSLEAVPPAAAVGLGLEAASKILGFFRSDYTIGGVQLSLEDSILLHALAGNETLRGKYVVRLPAQYNAQSLDLPTQGILKDLIALAKLKGNVAGRIEQHEKAKARFLTDAPKAKDPAQMQDSALLHEQATAVIKGAVAMYEGFFTKVSAADNKGNLPLSTVAREDVIARALTGGAALLLIKLQTSGGAYYTKKNLWTFFGGMPFYNMGGVVASYVLLSGKDGATLKSGVIPIHGGFVRSNEVQSAVEKRN